MRPFAIVLVLLAVGAALFGLWLLTGETAPPVAVPPPEAPAAVEAQAVAHAGGRVDAAGTAMERQVVAQRTSSLLEDPEFAAALTGWKGRVVDHEKNPVAGCGVRLYRGAMDSVIGEGLDLFADESTFVPQYVAGETQTASDGTFSITQVRPRGLFVLFAGIGTDAPTHQILSRMPSPGEVVDLGDIVLPNAGVLVGTVVDDDGEPLAGALVRAADIPGAIAAFFPLERFDPKGAVLIRERQATVQVVQMPPWVEQAFAHLPIPSTTTDGEGRFRLVGVVPGSNMVATTHAGFLSDVKPSIAVRAGQEKDVGKIRMRRGEELVGTVVDTDGEPVAGAELFAGSTIAVAPVDLAQRLEPSDAEGRFQGQGFAPGRVTVAARRGPGHPWVVAEPQPVAGEVVVTLPATYAVTAKIMLPGGEPAKEPRMRLLVGRPGQGAAEMHLLGFSPPIDLEARKQNIADGTWRIDNLQAGAYTLIADAPGLATAFAPFTIDAADVAVELRLEQPILFDVLVVDHEDRPVRNAAVYAQARGTQLTEMPIHCGRTGSDGRLQIDQLQAETLRVSAEHPRWGAVHGEAKPGQELRLVMQAPGRLLGVLLENGSPAPLGKYTVAVVRRRGDGPRGPFESTPGLVTPSAEGKFEVAALQPGRYSIAAIDSLEALRSPGGLVAMAQNAFLGRDRDDIQVDLAAGQTQEVVLDAGERPIEGPTANLAGSVTVNGRLATGYAVTVFGEERRSSAQVDERGRFDLGVVPAGTLHVTVHAAGEGGLFFGAGGGQLWSGTVTLQAAEARELTIDVTTASVSGSCHLPDGSPAAGVFVQVQGKLKSSDDTSGHVWHGVATDASGRFSLAQLPEGTYSFSVQGRGDKPMRGSLTGVVVTGMIAVDSLRIDLQPAVVVKGRLDLTAFGASKPDWCWLQFELASNEEDDDSGSHWAGVEDQDGSFVCDDLTAGRYRVVIHAGYSDDRSNPQYEAIEIDVPPAGLSGLQLRPVERRGS